MIAPPRLEHQEYLSDLMTDLDASQENDRIDPIEVSCRVTSEALCNSLISLVKTAEI